LAFAVPQLALTTGGLAAFSICLGIVVTKHIHGAHTMDSSQGIQKVHQHPTPRVGGLAIYVALVVSWLLTPPIVADTLGLMLIAVLPVFLAGIFEDVVKRDSVTERLMAAFVSGVLAWLLTGVSLKQVGIVGLDSLLAITFVSVLFTSFAVTGVVNAINIIDGLNGLASGVVLLCLASLGLIAYQVFDYEMAKLCFVVGGAVFGFMMVNYPYGKIFLGDGGAYLLGFFLGWIAVMIAARNPSVSPWAPMLACGYPILEVLFSMARRSSRKLKLGHPDRLHLHSLLWARLARRWFRGASTQVQNAAVLPMIVGYTVIPCFFAVYFKAETFKLIGIFLMCAFIYALIYTRLVHFSWTWPKLWTAKRFTTKSK